MFPALEETAAYLVEVCEARRKGNLSLAAQRLLELAEKNAKEQEIEDGIICARDSLTLYQRIKDKQNETVVRRILQELNDPLLER